MNSYKVSPFQSDVIENEAIFTAFFEDNNLELPPKHLRHFITHCDEFSSEAIQSLLSQYQKDGCPEGVHQYHITGKAVTRLWGPKSGNPEVNDERIFVERGAGRPPEPVFCKEKPYQDTSEATIIQFNGVIWTAHSGPSMPRIEKDLDPLWRTHSLAYTQEEILELKKG